MALPSEPVLKLLISNIVILFEKLYVQLTNVTAGYVPHEATVLDALLSDSPEMAQSIQSIRLQLQNTMAIQNFRAVMDPVIRTYGRVKGYPETDVVTILQRLYQDNAQGGVTIKTRSPVFGSITGPTGTGNGNIYRLTKDQYNFTVETPWAESKSFKCTADGSSGAVVNEELFTFYGTAQGKDLLDVRGSGSLSAIRSYSARDSLLLNPSFSNYSGTLPTVSGITNWTLDSGTLPVIDTTNYYRGSFGDTAPAAAKFAANAVISQLLSVRGSTVDPNTPYVLIVAYNRSIGSGDGTLTITMGSKTASVVMAAQSGWQRLAITLTNADAWFLNWGNTSPSIKVALSGWGTGYVLVDDVLFVPMVNVDGSWFTIAGGSTPFLYQDAFTWSDVNSDPYQGQNMKWFARKYGIVPAPGASSPTWVDGS